MEKLPLDKISTWVRFGIQVCLIPFLVYTIHSLQQLNTEVALIQQQIELRSSERDQQLESILTFIKDHESRIRALENSRNHP